MNLEHLSPDGIRELTNKQLKLVAANAVDLLESDRRENQLVYYEPVSPEAAKMHSSTARKIGIFGGNGSSKTTSFLAELSSMMTGTIPESLRGDAKFCSKFRGPINTRIVLESLTTTMHPIILPMLQYWKWTGISSPGGPKGHWGFIPRRNLIGGTWEKSWSEKLRIMRIKCFDPDSPAKYLGESTCQILSVDNDESDFASGDYHIIAHDEPPTLGIWRENEARTMRVAGRMALMMTWPDNPAIAVDWIYDEIYEKGREGSQEKDPNVECFNLYTTDNPYLDQEAVRIQANAWDESTRAVRIYGRPLRFSNLIHQDFTDTQKWWCFACGKDTLADKGNCGLCGGSRICHYNHVTNDPPSGVWPTIYLLDPHPRKPHMMMWVQVDPQDDCHQVAEAEVKGGPLEVREVVDKVERELHLRVVRRVMDPNMGKSPSSSVRGITWRDDFDAAGVTCDTIDHVDNFETGITRINDMLKPDKDTLKPRIVIHESCRNTIMHFKRYQWEDWSKRVDKDMKQKPKLKYDDYPALWRYLMNLDRGATPSFRMMSVGAPIIRRMMDRPNSRMAQDAILARM